MIDDDSPETKVVIRRHMTSVVSGFSSRRNWFVLRLPLDIPSSRILPADVQTIYYSQAPDTDYQTHQSAAPKRYTDNRWLYNWYLSLPITTPVLTGSDLATTINSTTITSVAAGFTAAMVGEYVRIGAHPGFYKIGTYVGAGEVTLTEGFRGADLSNPSTPANLTSQYFEVRPNGTKQLILHDELGDAITTGTFPIQYTRIPLPLYNDYDQIYLPGNCEAVLLKCLKVMDRTQRYSNDALKLDGDLEMEWGRMKALDFQPVSKPIPRDAMGHQIMFGRDKYSAGGYDSNSRRILS